MKMKSQNTLIDGKIYAIINMVTGEIYIGQTVWNFRYRIHKHFENDSPCVRLKNSIKKYGKEAFKWAVIAESDNLDRLNELEKFYIEEFNTLSPNGFNLRTGGKNTLFSDESRKRLSEAKTGHRHSEETKKKMSLAKMGKTYGRTHSEETKRKISETKRRQNRNVN